MSNKESQNFPRPPIVAILGHVDHGKTSLLDFIKKTNITSGEAGGITQSIGAYEIEHNGKKITFIDTPGHEAFSKMRIRGANVADLAILIVAADDGVKPQTKESIEILNSAKTPFIVAINKIDKQNTDIERAKNDLMANGVLLEGYGGNISWHGISAKTGEGINELLDLILLTAEMENLTYNPELDGSGVILEAKADSRKGIIATAIIKNGTLKTNQEIATKSAKGKIKILENFLGKTSEKLSPSSPAIILGFETLPQIGEKFFTGFQAISQLADLKIIPPTDESPTANPPTGVPQTQINETRAQIKNTRPILNLILKADVSGSIEILSEIIKSIPSENIKINIFTESIGEITDGDVKNASSTNAIIIGFKIKINKIAENLAKAQNVKIISSEIIYELIESVKNEMKLLEKPRPQGIFEVMKIFSQKGKEQLIGGKVILGTFRNNQRLKITRAEQEIGNSKITSIRKFKQKVNQISINEECGIFLESETKISEGDNLIWM